MKRQKYLVLGVFILGLSASVAYREFSSSGGSAGGRPGPIASVNANTSRSGQALPDLQFVNGSGAPRSLADFRGRVILLNLWATWCVPCRKEMPALDRLQAALAGPGFEVVALSLDQGGIATVKRFYEELGLRSLAIYVDSKGDALNKMGSAGIPLTVLVDRDGRELWRVLGPREWDQSEEADRIRSHLARSSP